MTHTNTNINLPEPKEIKIDMSPEAIKERIRQSSLRRINNQYIAKNNPDGESGRDC